ncbi:MAG TPA: hypothetical protein VGB42_02705 [Candidatus Thermoplasmatota archaeon]
MLVCFNLEALPGKEREFEALLSDKGIGERIALRTGARRNMIFVKEGKMVRILEFADGTTPVPLSAAAKEDPAIAKFLHDLAPLVKEGYVAGDDRSFADFMKRVSYPLAYDVRR